MRGGPRCGLKIGAAAGQVSLVQAEAEHNACMCVRAAGQCPLFVSDLIRDWLDWQYPCCLRALAVVAAVCQAEPVTRLVFRHTCSIGEEFLGWPSCLSGVA